MSPTTDGTTRSLDAVLTDFALAKNAPDAALLDEFTRRYPEFAVELTEYAVELALTVASDEAAPPPVPSVESNANALRAMSRFQNLVYEKNARTKASAQSSVANPFASLSSSEMRDLRNRLNVSSLFLVKIRDRRIHEESIPAPFYAQLARELPVPEATLRAHFKGPATLAPTTSYKADGKPRVESKETFEEAITSSSLTHEQQAALRKLLRA